MKRLDCAILRVKKRCRLMLSVRSSFDDRFLSCMDLLCATSLSPDTTCSSRGGEGAQDTDTFFSLSDKDIHRFVWEIDL